MSTDSDQNTETPDKRKQWILGRLESQDTIRFAEVRTKYDRSAAQNDLRDLVRQGELVRVTHGAYRRPPIEAGSELFRDGPYAGKLQLQQAEKRAIARCIVDRYCSGGSIIGLDAGTSCTAVARVLIERRVPVDIFTSNLHALLLLSGLLQLGQVRLKGGMVNLPYASISGQMSAEESGWRIDVAVVGVSGISLSTDETGRTRVELSTSDTTQHPFKEWLARAGLVVIPATQDRLGRQRGEVFARIPAAGGLPARRKNVLSLSPEQKIVVVTTGSIKDPQLKELQPQMAAVGVELVSSSATDMG